MNYLQHIILWLIFSLLIFLSVYFTKVPEITYNTTPKTLEEINSEMIKINDLFFNKSNHNEEYINNIKLKLDTLKKDIYTYKIKLDFDLESNQSDISDDIISEDEKKFNIIYDNFNLINSFYDDLNNIKQQNNTNLFTLISTIFL